MAQNRKFKKLKKVAPKKRGAEMTSHRELIRLRGRSLAVGSIIVLGVLILLGTAIVKKNPLAKLNPPISLSPSKTVLLTPTISGVVAQKSKPVVKKLPFTSSDNYVVKDGDSLARIGANVCGDKKAYLYLLEDFPFTLHPGEGLHIICR